MSLDKNAKIYEPYLSQADIAMQRFVQKIGMVKLTLEQSKTAEAHAESIRAAIKELDQFVTSIITSR